uniref:DUF1338 domain-containing protein n=1 Tax=Steinernema glaseri TaxID=37863 RepID=A0A1I8AML4_9BILA
MSDVEFDAIYESFQRAFSEEFKPHPSIAIQISDIATHHHHRVCIPELISREEYSSTISKKQLQYASPVYEWLFATLESEKCLTFFGQWIFAQTARIQHLHKLHVNCPPFAKEDYKELNAAFLAFLSKAAFTGHARGLSGTRGHPVALKKI